MGIFDLVSTMGHEQVAYCHDAETGLKAIVAIHDTTLGPALGGCRFWNYKTEEEALIDVLRLSRGMTYKAAVAGLPLGGGKAVIMGDPLKLKSETFFRRFGRFVDSLGGRYITAEDVNIKVEDINHVAKETKYVSGVTSRENGSGDPSPVTAYGVFHGIRASVKYRLGLDDLTGVRVAVQGTGQVGSYLCGYLHDAGAKLVVSDINTASVQRVADKYGAEIVDTNQIHAADVDVFAPCALGGILNDDTIPQIKAEIISGGANNQLLDEDVHGKMLADAGILYAPDYVVNAGGLINVCWELKGYDKAAVLVEAEKIYHTMMEVYAEAEKKGILTHHASDVIAEARIRKAKESVSALTQNFNNQSWITI